MNLLLDTHAVLWWLTDEPRLSRTAREAIADPASVVLASACSGYEIANKVRLGRLPAQIARALPVALARERISLRQIPVERRGSALRTKRVPISPAR